VDPIFGCMPLEEGCLCTYASINLLYFMESILVFSFSKTNKFVELWYNQLTHVPLLLSSQFLTLWHSYDIILNH
jgi:hypothetical protein